MGYIQPVWGFRDRQLKSVPLEDLAKAISMMWKLTSKAAAEPPYNPGPIL